MVKTLRLALAFFLVAFLPIAVSPQSALAANIPCDTYSWTGEDDNAHLMQLPYSLPLGDTTYNTVYVTTNGTMTFGTPDANFSSYPNTPSISLAGWDWVTFGEGASLSYGVTDSGFCVLWKVRPFPQSTGPITTIKLTVDVTRLPSWSGVIETQGWLPNDLRRGIRFTPGEPVVTISEAFTVNGGRPVEMQSCWDGSVIPLTSTCPAEPPPGQCWDGSTVAYNETCPPIPPDTQCWDGSWVTWSQTCPPEPPPAIVYPDDAVFITTNEGGQLNYIAPVGMKISQILFASYGTPNEYQYGPCHAENSAALVSNAVSNDTLVINADNDIFGDPCGGTSKYLSVVLTIETDPTYVQPTPTPGPEPTPTETVEPTPTPEPSPSESPTPEPTQTPEPEPTPTPTASPEPTPELPSPSPSSPAESIDQEPARTDEEDLQPEPEQPELQPEQTQPKPEQTETPEPEDSSQDNPTPDSAQQLADEAMLDGILTEEEKEVIADALIKAYSGGQGIPLSAVLAAGLDLADLPPNTPILLENGVVITAEIANAFEMLTSPSELLYALFNDPALIALALKNLGADMSPAEREESQKIVVAAIIVAGCAIQATATARR
jgi:hypothetical protein